MRSLPILVLLFLPLALPALAADGVLEISQTCAVQTGCFAGDAPGFPVTITAAAGRRSFRLTSDLGPLAATVTGINSTQVGVSIDLGGFRIFGSGVCTGVPVVSCLPVTGFGIDGGANSVVTNGEISGMGTGVRLGFSGRLEKMNLFYSNGAGIVLGDGSIAEGNISTSNSLYGIQCGDNCIVRGNAVIGNGSEGIRSGGSALVSQNSARLNGFEGIDVQFGSTVSGNTANLNNTGISAGFGSTVSGNTALNNLGNGIITGDGSTVSGNTVYGHPGDGINTGSGSTVSGNTVRQNTVVGLRLGSESGYRENVISNNGGTVTGGVNAGSNVCGTSLCP